MDGMKRPVRLLVTGDPANHTSDDVIKKGKQYKYGPKVQFHLYHHPTVSQRGHAPRNANFKPKYKLNRWVIKSSTHRR